MADVDRRDKFLLEMYTAFWSRITSAEESTWKMLAAYTALFAGLAFASQTIGFLAFSTLIIIFSFCALALSLNANLWFVRNINLIRNLEKEFLYANDYDVLIPKRYQDPYPFFTFETFEAWWVLGLVYFAVATIILAVSVSRVCCIQTFNEWLLTLATYGLCLILTVAYGLVLRHRFVRFIEHAPGKAPKNDPKSSIMT